MCLILASVTCTARRALQAGNGSTHGYDVLDHSRVNLELGEEVAFERLAKSLAKGRLGLMLDIVPNHIGGGGTCWKTAGQPLCAVFRCRMIAAGKPIPCGDAASAGRSLRSGARGSEISRGAPERHLYRPLSRSCTVILVFHRQSSRSFADADQLGFFTDALDQLPPSRATDWASLRRRHRNKGILLGYSLRVLCHARSTSATLQAWAIHPRGW